MSQRNAPTEQPWWPRAIDQIDWRLTLVLTMIVVGVSGSYVAYMVGVHELQATYFERELMQNNVLAMNERQMLLDLRDANAEFQRRIDAANVRGTAFLTASWSQHQPLNADLLTLRAQEEFAASRALQPFVKATRSSWDGAQDERAIQRRIARNVAKSGRESDESSDFRNMWNRLETKIEEDHQRVRELAIAVVFFVASLVMFTFAGLTSKRMAHGLLFAGVGFASATAISVMTILPGLRISASIILLLLGICALLAWKVGPPSKAAAEAHAEAAEGDAHGFAKGLHPPHARAGARSVVRWIAVTVLLSSMSGLGYSLATTASSEATHEALRAEIEMHLRNTKRQAEALDRLHRLARFQEARARFAAATQRATYFSSIDSTTAELAAAEAQASQIDGEPTPALQQELARLSDDFDQGVQDDARFLQGALRRIDSSRSDENHWESLAFWDLHNQRSLVSSGIAAAFLWTLTLFAVALYFFGQAIGMRKGVTGRVLTWTGEGLVCIALVYGASMFFVGQCRLDNGELACRRIDAKEPTSAELLAASRYAYGHALLSDARSDDDYAKAIDALSGAIETLPEWRLAQIDYVSAVDRQATFSVDQSFLRLPKKESISGTREAMDKALAKVKELNGQRFEQRKEPVSLLAGLGRYTWLDATVNGNERDLDRSIKYLSQALARTMGKDGDGTDFDRVRIELNLAVAYTIRGQDSEAASHITAALAASKSLSVGGPRLISRTMTDLEIVGAYCRSFKASDCEHIRNRVEQLKETLVAAAWGGPSTPASNVGAEPVAVRDVAVSVSATTATWQGKLGAVRPNDVVTVVWYRFDDEWKVWRALQEISGPVPGADIKTADTRVARSYFAASNFARCLGGDGDGRYRAELYINARRVGTGAETRFVGSRYQAAHVNNVNVALCRPVEWVAEPISTTANDGRLERGWRTADELVLKVYAFHSTTRSATARDSDPNSLLPLLKAALAKSGFAEANEQSYVRYDRGRPAECEASLNKAAFVYVDWATPDGTRYVGAGVPASDATADRSRNLCQALDSMTPLYPMSDSQQKARGRSQANVRAPIASPSKSKEP